MRLLEYQIDDVRRAVERYNETYGGATGEHDRQAIIDLVERIEEITERAARSDHDGFRRYYISWREVPPREKSA